jgi:hypothetical protein
MKTTPLRPHKVLGKTSPTGELHALAFTTGEFADIVFSYTNVKFVENGDALTIAYEYHLHDVPHHLRNFDKELLEKELGDFITALLYYGIEREKLGFIDDEQDRENDSFESDAQRSVLPEGGTFSKD